MAKSVRFSVSFLRTALLLSVLCAVPLSACKMDLDYLSEGSAGSGGGFDEGGSGGSSAPPEGGGGSFSSTGGSGSSGDFAVGGGGTFGTAGKAMEEGGTTGEGGAPPTPTGPKYDIVANNGAVVTDANTFGIDGEWREFGADVTLIETKFVGTQVCISGKLMGNSWGGGLQLVLHSPGPNGTPGQPYDAVTNQMAGIRLVVEGTNVPAKARIKFKQIGTNDDYCREMALKSGDLVTLRTSDALHSCPAPGGGAVNPTLLENFEIHMVPEALKDVTFDFCVKQVTVIPKGE